MQCVKRLFCTKAGENALLTRTVAKKEGSGTDAKEKF
jgi:hypothetical protein